MFAEIQERFSSIFSKLSSRGKLTEKNIKETVREIRRALLEADVNYKVVKEFTSSVEQRAVGQGVLNSVRPGQQFIKIVNDELTAVLGGETATLELSDSRPVKLMLVGLQGSGKTTCAGKLAFYYRQKGWAPLLVAADIYRPAAADQLEIVGKSIDVPTVLFDDGESAVKVCKRAVKESRRLGKDLVIFDTAGRLQVDAQMMDELQDINKDVKPDVILLVVDAMTGQEAVSVAKEFENRLDITGFVLTKLDGDARGGSALSLTHVTEKPVLFAGVGEKFADLELFHPSRMASRILGMGDVVSLVEKAETIYDDEQARELERKIRKQSLDLNDFLEQIKSIRKMGPIQNILEMMPGIKSSQLGGLDMAEDAVDRVEAIINSMTIDERTRPGIIKGSRKMRIANGSGTSVQEVNRLLKQFAQMKKMMKQMNSGSFGRLKNLGGRIWQ